MLPNYKLKISYLYNISIGNVKKLVPNSETEKHTLHIRIQSLNG